MKLREPLSLLAPYSEWISLCDDQGSEKKMFIAQLIGVNTNPSKVRDIEKQWTSKVFNCSGLPAWIDSNGHVLHEAVIEWCEAVVNIFDLIFGSIISEQSFSNAYEIRSRNTFTVSYF